MTFDPNLFRQTMRAWTTGVAVILASHQGETYGMTINSFTSLSLDPPLVTVVLQNSTHIHGLISQSRAFSVTILSADQQGLAENFAGKLHGPERMAGIQTRPFASGVPSLAGGLASLDCRVVHTYAAGANTLIVAEVLETRVASAEPPLAHHNREYRQLAPSP
jgi:flavin reductase (DIM6/NTAB) family NADH-FMN oxidoreductase RutF